MRPRLAFVGAGAVGGYVGGHLHRLGHDVTLIDPWPEHIEAIRARGLELTGVTEAERAVVEVPTMHLTEVQSLAKQRPIDIAFVSVKSYDTRMGDAPHRALPAARPATSSPSRTASTRSGSPPSSAGAAPSA